jgi:hypothetical protein
MTPDEAVKWYDAAMCEACAIRDGKRGEDESGPMWALRLIDWPSEQWFPGTEPVGRKPKYIIAPRAERDARVRFLLKYEQVDMGLSEREILARQFAAALLLAID